MTHQINSALSKGLLLLVSLLSITAIWVMVTQHGQLSQELMAVLRQNPAPLKPFELLDQNEQLINEQTFKDKWSFVFFGYTSCPDICPTTLQVLNSVTDILASKNEALLQNTQVVFVSVDPERDTTAKLADYMAFFNRDFIGVTGDKKNIDNFTRQLGAGYMMDKETAPGQYLVAHTSAIFLLGPEARLVAVFSQPHDAQTIVSLYQRVRAYLSE